MICKICGNKFQPCNPMQKTCSSNCAMENKKRNGARWRKEHKAARVCRCCGVTFEDNGNNLYCSDDCRKSAARKSKRDYQKRFLQKNQLNTIVVCPMCGKKRIEEGRFDRAARSFCETCKIKAARYAA